MIYVKDDATSQWHAVTLDGPLTDMTKLHRSCRLLREGYASASRWCGTLLRVGMALLMLIPGIAPGAPPNSIVVGGTGSSAPLIRLLADEFEKTHAGLHVAIMSPPLGSGGGLRALFAGNVDLAISALPPTPEQRLQLGDSFELARTPFVFATRDGQRAQGFRMAELADVYAGRLVKWTNGLPLRLILRSEYDAETRILRSMSRDIDRENRNALHRKGMVIAENDLDALDLIERIEGSLGTTTLGLVKTRNSKVSILMLNGVMPNLAALEHGTYPWFKPLYVVASRSPPPATLRFIEFLRSPRAREIMRHVEYLPGLP